MDSCRVCSNQLESEKKIACSGTCGLTFHYTCVGLGKSQYSSLAANIGLLWFCAACRLNFNPAAYDREKKIMKALRELLIRTDSMDTRLGNYGENLRKINRTLYGTQQQNSQTDLSLDQTDFNRKIDMLNFDDTLEDPINRSRSCDDTSFFEVLDEINSTVVQPVEKFSVGNKRVQIIDNPKPSTSKSTSNPTQASTSAATLQTPNAVNSPTNVNIITNHERVLEPNSDNRRSTLRPTSGPLSVAKVGHVTDDMMDFYVTPFTPDQKEEDVKRYILEIANVNPSTLKVVKLVPRGKILDDLSFVSFKISVDKSASNMIGDPWYWPEGVTVRVFDHRQKNGPLTLRSTAT